jgi:hypothetical protein
MHGHINWLALSLLRHESRIAMIGRTGQHFDGACRTVAGFAAEWRIDPSLRDRIENFLISGDGVSLDSLALRHEVPVECAARSSSDWRTRIGACPRDSPRRLSSVRAIRD